MVNQAVQITPGAAIHQTPMAAQIQCDSATLNISPFVSVYAFFGKPDNRLSTSRFTTTVDNFGLIDPEGLDGPDGNPDNPGTVLYYKPQRHRPPPELQRSMAASQPRSPFHSIDTTSTCVSRQPKNKSRSTSKIADKRLDLRDGRLKACAEAIKDGYGFAKDSCLRPSALM